MIELGDYLEISQKLIPDESIDLVLVDPPYCIGYGGAWDKKNFMEFTEIWVKEAFRILKPEGTLISFMGYENLFTHKGCSKGFVNILEDRFTVHLENMVVWARQKGRGSSKHLKSQREDIIHATKDEKRYTWNNLKTLREVVAPYVKDGRPRGWFLDSDGMRKRWTGLGNVWVYSAPQWNGKVEKQWHPAQKPVMVMERLIRLASNPGDTVVDFFTGSGTTGIACNLSGRKFIGMESDKKTFATAKERIENFKAEIYEGYNDEVDKLIITP